MRHNRAKHGLLCRAAIHWSCPGVTAPRSLEGLTRHPQRNDSEAASLHELLGTRWGELSSVV
jgi:hypothetical protein